MTVVRAGLIAVDEVLRTAVRRAEVLDKLDSQLEHPIRDHALGLISCAEGASVRVAAW
jgi:hypothetical protein